MGRNKELLDLLYSPSDGMVCSRCIGDRGIADFIRTNANSVGCSFCDDSNSRKRRSCDIDSVLDFMTRRIHLEWQGPEHQVPYETAEGGYVGADILDTSDLLQKVIEVDFNNDRIADAVIGSIRNDSWVKVDFFGLRPHEELFYQWSSFCNLVKSKSRFVFYKHRNTKSSSANPGSEVSQILATIGKFAKTLRLTVQLPAGTKFYRARRVTKSSTVTSDVRGLGPPPYEVSAKFPNRMSPPGIPMFYGAFEIDTALAEIATPKLGTALIGVSDATTIFSG